MALGNSLPKWPGIQELRKAGRDARPTESRVAGTLAYRPREGVIQMRFSQRSVLVRACAVRGAFGALLICTALVCVAASAAQAASNALWIGASGDDTVDEYLPSQLKRSGSPTPLTVPFGSYAYGVCFDKAKNLWATDDAQEVLEFPASGIKKIPEIPSPITITSSSFVGILGCAFDKRGNLWLADSEAESLDEISAAQIKARGGSITPAVIITGTLDGASFVTFDKSGNLWTAPESENEVLGFSASQLTSGGAKAAAVILGGGGSLDDPGQIGFDQHGNLWVTNYGNGTVVMFSKSRLGTSNDDAPAITISSSALVGPWGLAFHSSDMWVLDYTDHNALEFSSSQLKSSGAPVPKVVLTGATSAFNWQITFGPAYGK
jgi:DNA-binding beta-propeller fold protein YncE